MSILTMPVTPYLRILRCNWTCILNNYIKHDLACRLIKDFEREARTDGMPTAVLAMRKKDLVQELNKFVEQKKLYSTDAQSRTALLGKGGIERELTPSEKIDGEFQLPVQSNILRVVSTHDYEQSYLILHDTLSDTVYGTLCSDVDPRHDQTRAEGDQGHR